MPWSEASARTSWASWARRWPDAGSTQAQHVSAHSRAIRTLVCRELREQGRGTGKVSHTAERQWSRQPTEPGRVEHE